MASGRGGGRMETPGGGGESRAMWERPEGDRGRKMWKFCCRQDQSPVMEGLGCYSPATIIMKKYLSSPSSGQVPS